MKKLLLSFSALFMVLALQAQIKTPAASPNAKVMQTVGLTDIMVKYNRPSMKGRTIFAADGLVPFGQLWRTGANQATKIMIDGDVSINGVDVKGGDYAILSKPGAASWTIHLYPYGSTSWSSYTDDEPAYAITATPRMGGSSAEHFTMAFDKLTSSGAELQLIWDKTIVPLQIETMVDDAVMKNIDRVLAGPSAADYHTAASYYHDSGKNLEKALMMINKAVDVEAPKFWHVRRKALILYDLGKVKQAIKAAELSRDLAIKADYAEYIRLNEESIKEWSK